MVISSFLRKRYLVLFGLFIIIVIIISYFNKYNNDNNQVNVIIDYDDIGNKENLSKKSFKNAKLEKIKGKFDEEGEIIDEFSGINDNNSNNSFVVSKKTLGLSEYLKQIEKMRCPSDTNKVIFLYPHVNKAGGRSIEGTFDEPEVRHRFVSSLPRSRRLQLKFELRNGHKSFRDLLQLHCSVDPNNNGDINKSRKILRAKECEEMLSKGNHCARWIFTMREPMNRALSAFYTSTGREVQSDPDLRTHFTCPVGSQAAKILSNPKSTFEDFADLPKEKQEVCYPWIANRHVHYLAGEVSGNDTVRLEVAKRRLERMGWVGMAEDFDKSIRLLSWTFGLDLTLYTPVFNVNDYPKSLSSNAATALKNMNLLDIELYNFAKKLFNQRAHLMEKFLRENEDHTSEYFPFICDKEVICWDKTKGQPTHGTSTASTKDHLETIDNNYWSIKSPPPIPKDVSYGEWKERVVCAPKNGCFRG